MFDPFYLIVDSAEWLRRLLPLGVKLVQLRVKNLSPAKLRREIAQAQTLCTTFGAQLVVNDYWKLALELGCDHVHLGQEDLDAADIPAIKRAGMKFGVSTHNDTELQRALAFDPNYIALGPIYPTILKQMPWKPQGLEKITLWKQRIGNLPLIAIGGLNIERAAGVVAAGADSLAVVTDVTLNADPEARVRQWLDATRSKRGTA